MMTAVVLLQKNGRQGEESETRRIITYAVPEVGRGVCALLGGAC